MNGVIGSVERDSVDTECDMCDASAFFTRFVFLVGGKGSELKPVFALYCYCLYKSA